jgi:hypothetical protein
MKGGLFNVSGRVALVTGSRRGRGRVAGGNLTPGSHRSRYVEFPITGVLWNAIKVYPMSLYCPRTVVVDTILWTVTVVARETPPLGSGRLLKGFAGNDDRGS